MTRITKFLSALRPDDDEFRDLSGCPQDFFAEHLGSVHLRPFKFKFYDWDEVQRALQAGAASVEVAKQGLTPRYFEFQIGDGIARLVVLERGEKYKERASASVSMHEGMPQIECWDERADSNEPDARIILD